MSPHAFTKQVVVMLSSMLYGYQRLNTTFNPSNRLPFFLRRDDIFFACIPPII